jgi:hypothetical protein
MTRQSRSSRTAPGAGLSVVTVDDTLAPALIGAEHLLFASREGIPPEAGPVRKVVSTVVAGVALEPRP